MIPSDQPVFYKFMKDIFLEEWPAVPALKPDQLSRWFRALEVIDIARIKKAFEEYLCDSRQSKFPPKEGQILEIVKTIPFDTRSVRCTWQGCREIGSEMIRNYFYCLPHYDEMIVKNEPDSIQAQVIVNINRLKAEAKAAGITSLEYFKKSEPALFNAIKRRRGEDKVRAAEEKILRAIADFYETKIEKEDRDRIVGKMKVESRYYKLREENKETC